MIIIKKESKNIAPLRRKFNGWRVLLELLSEKMNVKVARVMETSILFGIYYLRKKFKNSTSFRIGC